MAKEEKRAWRFHGLKKAVGIVAFLAGALYLFLSVRSGDPIRRLPEELSFQDGDVLLLGSSTLRGRILKAIDGGTAWAHVGLVCCPDDESVCIIHADPELGIVKQRLQSYLDQNDVDALLLLRLDRGNGKVAASYANRLAEARVPFKRTFCYKRGDGYYCTELVLRAWENAGEVIMPNVKVGDAVRPSELLSNSSALRVVWQVP